LFALRLVCIVLGKRAQPVVTHPGNIQRIEDAR
jgi:hypothetical protein